MIHANEFGVTVCTLGSTLGSTCFADDIFAHGRTIGRQLLVLELLNTATEAVVDLSVGRRFHPLARIAKDCAAAAVLVAALSSLMIALLLLVPPLLVRLGI